MTFGMQHTYEPGQFYFDPRDAPEGICFICGSSVRYHIAAPCHLCREHPNHPIHWDPKWTGSDE